MKHDKKCQCCSIGNYDELKIPLKCADGTKQIYPVSIPKTCQCQSCDADAKSNPDNVFDFLKSTVIY